MRWIVVVLGSLAVLGLLAYIRLAPSDPLRWHLDPLAAPVPQENGWLLRDSDGNAASPVFSALLCPKLCSMHSIPLRSRRRARRAWLAALRRGGLPGSPERG